MQVMAEQLDSRTAALPRSQATSILRQGLQAVEQGRCLQHGCQMVQQGTPPAAAVAEGCTGLAVALGH